MNRLLIGVAAAVTTRWVATDLSVPVLVQVGVFVGFVLVFAGAFELVRGEQ